MIPKTVAYKNLKGLLDLAIQRGLFANAESVANMLESVEALKPADPQPASVTGPTSFTNSQS